MHPRSATLIAFCDGEAAADHRRRIAKHLSRCENCRDKVRRIRAERDGLSALAATPVLDAKPDWNEVLSAVAAWQANPSSPAAAELKRRLRSQIETYLGCPAVLVVDTPGIRTEEMFGKASEMLEVFLGPQAAQAVSDDVLRRLDWPHPPEEFPKR